MCPDTNQGGGTAGGGAEGREPLHLSISGPATPQASSHRYSEGCYQRPQALPLGSRARASPSRLCGKDTVPGWTATLWALLSFPRPLGSPPRPSAVICQYTVIRDVARLIKIAACPKMELPSRTCLIKVLIDKMKKSHPETPLPSSERSASSLPQRGREI